MSTSFVDDAPQGEATPALEETASSLDIVGPPKEQAKSSCMKTTFWFRRNFIHIVLLLLAIFSVVGTLLGSLERCEGSLENVTVTYEVQTNVTRNVTMNVTRLVSRNVTVNITQNVTISVTRNVTRDITVNVTKNVTTTTQTVTPLDAVFLIDGSGSMCLDTFDATVCPASYDFIGNTHSCGTICACSASCPDFGYNMCCRTETPSNPCQCQEMGDRWSAAKGAIVDLNNLLNEKMNNGTSGSKYRSGLIQWSDRRADWLKIEANLTEGNETTSLAAENMALRSMGTHWGTGLCQCYKMLMENANASTLTNKMCILMADGTSYERLGADENGVDCTQDLSRGSQGPCYCDYLWEDAKEFTSANGYVSDTSSFVEEFIKYQNITIMSMLADDTASETAIYNAASCDGIVDSSECDYFFRLSTFDELDDHANDIADLQRTVSTTTAVETVQETTQETREELVEETSEEIVQNTTQQQVEETSEETVEQTTQETVQETSVESMTSSSEVSICSLDFLYGLIAFVPFLLYVVYRTIQIKAMSRKIRKQLSEKIQRGELRRGDWGLVARAATGLLLPNKYRTDIDYWISYCLHLCPCLRTLSRHEFEELTALDTICL